MPTRLMKSVQPEKSANKFTGMLIDHFPVRNKSFRRWSLLLTGILVAIFSISLLVIRLITLTVAIQTYGRAIILNHAPILLVLLFLALPVSILTIIHARNHWNDGITIYTEGFTLRHGLKIQRWIWQKTIGLDTRIIHVRFGGSDVFKKVKIEIVDQEGKIFSLKNRYERISDLLSIIRSHILPVLMVHARLCFVQDYPIQFGKKLKADSHGMIINDRVHSWQELDVPVIRKDRLILMTKQHKPILQLKIRQIKNLDLLIHLIKYPPGTPARYQPR